MLSPSSSFNFECASSASWNTLCSLANISSWCVGKKPQVSARFKKEGIRLTLGDNGEEEQSISVVVDIDNAVIGGNGEDSLSLVVCIDNAFITAACFFELSKLSLIKLRFQVAVQVFENL